MIEVFDCRTDLDHNLLVHPHIRCRFLKLEPLPPAPLHSHDLGGEVFLVIEGHCEFLVEDERVTCGPGQMIYVEPMARHSLHAVGDGPCILYLSLTPHVEPTHTFYDAHGERRDIRYDAWRGRRHPDGSADRGLAEVDPGFGDGTLAARLVTELTSLAKLSRRAAQLAIETEAALADATRSQDEAQVKRSVDRMWLAIRGVVDQTTATEAAWNALAPQAMPRRNG